MRRMSLIAVTGVVAIGLSLRLRVGLHGHHLAGCRNTAAGTSAAGGGVDAALAAEVPAEMKAAGVIKVGIDPTYAPNEMLADGKTVEGFDVDIFNAVAAKLGLKTEYQPATFGTIILGVTGGKYDIGVSSFRSTTSARSRSTWSATTAPARRVVAKGNPEKVNMDDVCGKSVGAQKDTVQAEDLAARSKKCTDAGKGGITQVIQVKQDQVTADVVSGKTVAMLADSPVGLYAVKQTSSSRPWATSTTRRCTATSSRRTRPTSPT